MKHLLRLKIRYQLSIAIVIIAIVSTPNAILSVDKLRGYKAFGGEYLLIPLALLIAYGICQLMQVYDEIEERSNKEKRKIHRNTRKKFNTK